MAIIVICSCGVSFNTYPSKIRQGRGKFCSQECSYRSYIGKSFSPQTQFKTGVKPSFYKGYSYRLSRKGGNKYKEIYLPNHPNATKRGYVLEHRLLIEKKIGRLLTKDEIVHHKDGNTLNNAISNLELMLKVEHDRMNTSLNIHKRWSGRRVMPPSCN